jgi:hypothetical protein
MTEKFTVVGEPMTPQEFGELLKKMYEKDENGVPRWKKVFGVKDEHVIVTDVAMIGETSDKRTFSLSERVVRFVMWLVRYPAPPNIICSHKFTNPRVLYPGDTLNVTYEMKVEKDEEVVRP